MQLVATNVRFSKDEYISIKKLAFAKNKSMAQFIREATRFYRRQELSNKQNRQQLLQAITQAAVDIDVPVTELVHADRKFA